MKSFWQKILLTAAAVPLIAAGTEGWDNLDPDRSFLAPGRVYFSENFESENAIGNLNVEFCDGAQGEVKVIAGVVYNGGKALFIKKSNTDGYIKITPKKPFVMPDDSPVQCAIYVHCRSANPLFSPAFIRMYGQKEDLRYFKGLDGRGPGGPKMDYLTNTPPGIWERKLCRLKIDKDTGRAITPAIIVAGSPSESFWDAWQVENLNDSLNTWRDHQRAMKMERQVHFDNRSSDVVSEKDFEAALAADVDHTAAVVKDDGIAKLLVDGKETPPVLFKDSVGKKIFSGRVLQDSGVKVQAITIRFGDSPAQRGAWSKRGFDTEYAVKYIRERMRMSDKSVFLISMICDAYPEFTTEHPEEVWRCDDGTLVWGQHVHASYWVRRDKMDPKRNWLWPSMHSVVWREGVKNNISKLVAELKRTGLSKRIVGFHIGGFHDHQFATRHMDYSKPAVEGFRKYLKNKYKTVAALEKAWNVKIGDFSAVKAPQFEASEYFTPGEDQAQIDFFIYQKLAPFMVQEEIAAHTKKCFGKDVIAVRWCMEALSGTLTSAFDIGAFANSKHIDAIVAQPGYPTRTPGLPNEVRLPLASFRHKGKLFIDEFDLRTYGGSANEVEMRVLGLSNASDFPMWQSIHHKLAGKMIAEYMGYWYFDMAGGWFEPPEIRWDIAQVNQVRDMLLNRPRRQWSPSVAVVVDESGLMLRNIPHSNYNFDQQRLVGTQLTMLCSASVPHEAWLLEDWLKNPELAEKYQVIIFAGMFHIDGARKALVEKLQNKNRTLVYLAGTGVLGGADVTGLKWQTLAADSGSCEILPASGVAFNMASPLHNEQLTRNLGVKLRGKYHRPTRYTVKEESGVKVWSRFKTDNYPAVASKKYKNSRAVAVGLAGALTPDLLNFLTREAGGYVSSRPGLQINMNGNFVSIHALIPGKYRFELPFDCQVRNLKNGMLEKCRGNSFEIDAEAGSSYWFALENHGEKINPQIYKERKPVMKKRLAAVGAALIVGAGASAATPLDAQSSWKTFKKSEMALYTFNNGKITITGKDGKYNSALFCPLGKSLAAGKKYVLSANVKLNAADTTDKSVRINVRCVTPAGKTLTYRGFDVDMKNTNARNYAAEIDIPSGTDTCQLFIRVGKFAATDNVVISNLQLKPYEALKAGNGNLVVNGDFEYPALSNWATHRGAVKKTYFYTVDDDGKSVLAVTGDVAKYSSTTLFQELPKVSADKKYTLTAKVRVRSLKYNDGKKFQLTIRSATEKNKTITYFRKMVDLKKDGWQEYQLTFSPHPEAKRNQLYITSDKLEPGDMILVDDVVVSEVK